MTDMKLQDHIEYIFSHDVLAYDTETTGLKYKVDTVFGVSISVNPTETPLNEVCEDDFYWDTRDTPEIVVLLNQAFERYQGTIICHNAPFDYKMSHHSGIYLPIEQIEDTAIRAKLIDEHVDGIFPWTRRKGDYSLEWLCRKYLGVGKFAEAYEQLAELFGGRATRNVQMPNLHRAPVDIVAPYAKFDTRRTLELYQWQESEIEAQEIHQICEFEKQLQPVLIRNEMHGVRVDVEKAKLAQTKLTIIIDDKQTELNELAGKSLNVNSPSQVKSLFEFYQDEDGQWYVIGENGDIPLGTTNSGNPSLNAEALVELNTPITRLISEIRSLIKTRDTFLGTFVVKGHVDGRIYANWNQVLNTGRLSIKSPSLQNIPSRNKEVAEIVKSVFLPDEDQVWVEGDLASNEVRIFAHLVAAYNDSLVLEYQKNPRLDLHQYVADLTGLPRNKPPSGGSNAKQLNLSAIFNQGRGHTAQKMNLPWEWSSFKDKNGNIIKYQRAGDEANRLIDLYHARVQGIKTLANKATAVAESRGFIRTKIGRKLRFPNNFKTYKASGLLIQATAGDINKALLIFIDKIARQFGGHLLVNTHDSYSISLPKDTAREAFQKIQDEVANPTYWTPTRVPLILEFDGMGYSWWGAKNGEIE